MNQVDDIIQARRSRIIGPRTWTWPHSIKPCGHSHTSPTMPRAQGKQHLKLDTVLQVHTCSPPHCCACGLTSIRLRAFSLHWSRQSQQKHLLRTQRCHWVMKTSFRVDLWTFKVFQTCFFSWRFEPYANIPFCKHYWNVVFEIIKGVM